MSLTNRIRRNLRVGLPIIALAAGLGMTPASAQTLQEALAQAYSQNPTLEAGRAQLRATDELVPQARSGYLPTVTATGDARRAWQERGPARNAYNQQTADISVAQPIYRGGRTVAAVNRAENLVQAQRASLLRTEQQVLLDVATAYLDVLRDQAVQELTASNTQVLRRQLEASQDRFRVGEITRTDVSQAESRLARAEADRILSDGVLNSSRAVFARLVGTLPANLSQPQLTLTLPNSLAETIQLAEANNPQVLAAEYAFRASDNAVDQVAGEMLPTVTLNGSASRTWDPLGAGGTRDDAAIIARVTVPIFQGGGDAARVREARHTANQRRLEVEQATRASREAAIRAWEGLVTARSSIQSRQSQVRAADIALEGVRQEATVGSRTVLDVLDAEQELLDARVQLVRAQRDELVAAFQVLAATGQLTAGRLGLAVQAYDVEGHYQSTRGRFWGTSVTP